MLRECAAGDAVAEMPLVLTSEDALRVAWALVARRIVTAKAADDALHIAIATIYGIDYLLTRNRRHIANPEIERNISLYLEQVEFFLPFICTPEELLGDGNE